MIEKDLERQVVQWAEERGGEALKLSLPTRGFPDRTILLPGGRILFAELKRPGKSKTYFMQRQWVENLQSLGFDAGIFDSLIELKERFIT